MNFTLNPEVSFFVIVFFLIVIIVLFQNFIRSSFGRAILAVREDEIAANSNGIGVFKYKMTGFIIASFVAGIGVHCMLRLLGLLSLKWHPSIEVLSISSLLCSVEWARLLALLCGFTLTSLQEFYAFARLSIVGISLDFDFCHVIQT